MACREREFEIRPVYSTVRRRSCITGADETPNLEIVADKSPGLPRTNRDRQEPTPSVSARGPGFWLSVAVVRGSGVTWKLEFPEWPRKRTPRGCPLCLESQASRRTQLSVEGPTSAALLLDAEQKAE